MTSKIKHKVLVIGLDGATFDLLEPLIANGDMPNLGRLIDEGICATLESTAPPITAVAWTSFMTGVNPGKHGIFGFRTYDAQSQIDRFATSKAIRSPTLWFHLSRHNKRMCIINLPMNYPPPKVNGILVSGFDAPSKDSAFTYPEAFKVELLTQFPDYTILPAKPKGIRTQDEALHSYTVSIKRAFQQRVQLSNWLMSREDWDFLMVQFQAVDGLQHVAWPDLNPTGPISGNERRRQMALACYRYLDKQIATLLSHPWVENTNIFIISDHGFSLETKCIAPNNLLAAWGYLKARSSNTQSATQSQRSSDGISAFKDRLRNSHSSLIRSLYKLGVKLKQNLCRVVKTLSEGSDTEQRSQAAIRMLQDTSLSSVLDVDWSKTRACAITAEKYALIYLNIVGRDRYGIVKPDQVNELIDELIDRFRTVIDPDSGQYVFKHVVRGEKIYQAGPGVVLPDIVLIPCEKYSTTTRSLDPRGSVYRRPHPIGGHHPDGIFIAWGPDIRSGKLENRLNIIDIAPTVMHILGLPVPRNMDGQVVLEVLRYKTSVKYEEPDEEYQGLSSRLPIYSDGELSKVEERLKDLGYLQ